MAGMTVGKIVVESDPTLTKISQQLEELIALLKADRADRNVNITTGHNEWRRPGWAETGPSSGAV